jgi:hypothetical protein
MGGLYWSMANRGLISICQDFLQDLADSDRNTECADLRDIERRGEHGALAKPGGNRNKCLAPQHRMR